MELENHRLIKGFISKSERDEIIDFVNKLTFSNNIKNNHIKEVAKSLNGKSFMFDISKTNISNYLSDYQSSGNIIEKELPDIFYDIINRISDSLDISKDNIFLQIIDMNSGGEIRPHYDTSIDGYINYKCNMSILSEDYKIYIDKTNLDIELGDLYSFEASLYKHWTDKFQSRRILLSYGFALKYADLNRSDNDPRVRLSKRIFKYFQY
jgi:hypothetical protein